MANSNTGACRRMYTKHRDPSMCDADIGLPITGSNHPIADGDAYDNQASQCFCIKSLQCLDMQDQTLLTTHYHYQNIMVLVQRNE